MNYPAKSVLIVISKDKKDAIPLKDKIVDFLNERDISSDVHYYDGFSYDEMEIKRSFTHAISLGGDGTVLFTARFCASFKVPVFPINFGRFGFIASVEPSEWERKLELFIQNRSDLYERLLLYATVTRKKEVIARFEALNDIVVSGASIGKLVNLNVSFNEIPFGSYRGDGIIISTPTGSTAYSVASGGPILDPTVSAFVLTPMAPFSLSNRPIVLPSSGTIKIETPQVRHANISLLSDGQKLLTLKKDDIVSITESKHKVLLAYCSPMKFYSALNSKLGWQGSVL
ncbi:MAG: NAD(+)/NADH kinase [Treponema sp.]